MIRLATLEDRPHFLRLWSQYLQDQEKAGSRVLGNLNNLYQFLSYFEGYATGSQLGGTLLCQPSDAEEPVAVVMGGETGPEEFETDLGKTAMMWGIYVDPKFRGRGIGLKMIAESHKFLLEWGFDSVNTYTRTDNTDALKVAAEAGLSAYMIQQIVSLRDPKMLNNEEARKTLARGGE